MYRKIIWSFLIISTILSLSNCTDDFGNDHEYFNNSSERKVLNPVVKITIPPTNNICKWDSWIRADIEIINHNIDSTVKVFIDDEYYGEFWESETPKSVIVFNTKYDSNKHVVKVGESGADGYFSFDTFSYVSEHYNYFTFNDSEYKLQDGAFFKVDTSLLHSAILSFTGSQGFFIEDMGFVSFNKLILIDTINPLIETLNPGFYTLEDTNFFQAGDYFYDVFYGWNPWQPDEESEEVFFGPIKTGSIAIKKFANYDYSFDFLFNDVHNNIIKGYFKGPLLDPDTYDIIK